MIDNSSICQHLLAVKELKQSNRYECSECVKSGDHWVHLRTCQTCGVTLCCDSSPNQHMSKHAAANHHPVAISSEPGEHWLWCYIDQQGADYE